MRTLQIIKVLDDEFQSRIAKFEKKWGKINIVSKEEKTVVAADEYGVKHDIEVYEYTISNEMDDFRINGYKYLGQVKYDAGIPMVESADIEKPIYNTVDLNSVFACSHCGKKIENRVYKIFFVKEDTGEICNYGKTCAINYFGEDVITKLQKGINALCMFVDEIREEMEEGFGSRCKQLNDFNFYFETSIQYFKNGAKFVSRQAEQNDFSHNTVSTYSMMVYLYDDKSNTIRESFNKEYPIDNASLENEIKNIIAYYENLEVKNDFDFNMKNQIVDHGSKIGIVIYAVFNYYNQIRKAEEAAKKAESGKSEYYPVADKKRVEINNAQCVSVSSYDSPYGISYITVFMVDNYKLISFGNVGQSVEKGKVYKIKATKIQDQEYRGEKQTVINRVAILETIA